MREPAKRPGPAVATMIWVVVGLVVAISILLLVGLSLIPDDY